MRAVGQQDSPGGSLRATVRYAVQRCRSSDRQRRLLCHDLLVSDDLGADQTVGEAGLLEYVLSNFVRPVLHALTGTGLWTPETALTQFEIRLLDNGEASIQLNGANTAWSRARAVRDFAPGEAVGPSDLVTTALPGVPTSDTFIKGTLDGSNWLLEYQFGGAAEKRLLHLQLADEFLASAHDDLAASRTRSAFTSAFHAAEHYAKAELLHYPLTAALVESSKKHTAVRGTYAVWARLGNAPRRFGDVLNRLDRERGRATYLEDEWTTDRDLAEVIATLDEMRVWVTAVVEGRGPKTIHVISTGDIAAGSLVEPDDVGLWPPRSAAP